jgi:hypothetical protein
VPTSPSIARLRRRLPLIVFVLLAVACLLLIGFACACVGHQPGQTTDQVVPAPAVIELWSLIVLSLLAVPLLFMRLAGGFGRASPAQLQRFLF